MKNSQSKPDSISSSLIDLKHLRVGEVLELVGVAERTWLRWVKEGAAPKPVRLGERAVAWRLSDLREWLESREAANI